VIAHGTYRVYVHYSQELLPARFKAKSSLHVEETVIYTDVEDGVEMTGSPVGEVDFTCYRERKPYVLHRGGIGGDDPFKPILIGT
jgi:hypothetical protein